MPWSKASEAPENIRKLNGVPLTLEQMNWIAKVADAIDSEYNWAIAISKFKKSFKVSGNSWKKKSESVEEKEFSDVLCEKQDNGRYKIVSVSTAALRDREGETFTVKAIDYEIKRAKETGEYPEFRVFHKQPLGIGRVKSMKRVGIFAVEEGESYDDPFSLDVCEKMLSRNDGKWKTSRGFKVLEASGGCPHCGESLLIREKHMVAGFICPSCGKTNLGFKGSLNDTRFLKTKTFDITVTDVPAVPWTGVAAFRFTQNDQEVVMTKKELKKRLVKAGLSEEAIDARLATISEDTLKSFDDIPVADILKEFEDTEEDDVEEEDVDTEEDGETSEKELGSSKEEQVFTLDPAVLKEFSNIAKQQLMELLEGATFEAEDTNVNKESEVLAALDTLSEQLKELTDRIDALTEKDETRLKEIIADAPRGSALRITRFKQAAQKKSSKMPVEDTEEDDEEEVPTSKSKKNCEKEVGILGSDGTVSKSMTEFLVGTKGKQ